MSIGFRHLSESIHLEGIGDIRLVRSKRARRLSISIKPFQGIRVTIPHGVPEKEAIRFIQERYDWIEKNLGKMRATENRRTIYDENSSFRTRSRYLVIRRPDSESVTSRITKKVINLSVPVNMDIADFEIQERIRAAIHKALRKEAKEYLPQRTDELALAHNLLFKEVRIRNNKTRWGSCTGDNKIYLNLHLMRLPDYLIDYVILHELAHTQIKNHSRTFWNLLDSICPGSKNLDKDLNRYSTYLY